MRFLSIGECMAELAPSTHPGDYRLGFAGDAFNTAWYLARIQSRIEVAFLTAIGSDALSQRMREAFVAGGIDVGHVRTVPDRTVGLYLITLEKGERSFSYWRGQSAARVLADDEARLSRAMADADMVYVSGITLGILDGSGRERMIGALTSARADGKTIVFDPNLRPGLWPDTDTMIRATMRGAEVCDVALPSFEDEARWFGDADPAATAQRYAGAGAGTVIVKNGAEPVFYLQGRDSGTVAVPPLSAVVDTTAAGDSFNAAVIWGMTEGRALPAAIARACKLSGQVVQGKGALVPVDPSSLDG